MRWWSWRPQNTLHFLCVQMMLRQEGQMGAQHLSAWCLPRSLLPPSTIWPTHHCLPCSIPAPPPSPSVYADLIAAWARPLPFRSSWSSSLLHLLQPTPAPVTPALLVLPSLGLPHCPGAGPLLHASVSAALGPGVPCGRGEDEGAQERGNVLLCSTGDHPLGTSALGRT